MAIWEYDTVCSDMLTVVIRSDLHNMTDPWDYLAGKKSDCGSLDEIFLTIPQVSIA